MTNSPDESLPKGVERFVGSSGLISPLKRGLRVHLWFASPFSGTRTVAMSAPPLSVWKKWQVDWCHLCFFPSYSSCLCLSNVLHTHNYEQYDTTPLTQQFLKLKNPMMNQTKKKTQPLSSIVIKIKCVYHSIHPWLRNTSRKNPSPCPLLPTCWAPAFCCSKTKVHNLSYLMQPGMTMGWIVQHFPRESQGVTR